MTEFRASPESIARELHETRLIIAVGIIEAIAVSGAAMLTGDFILTAFVAIPMGWVARFVGVLRNQEELPHILVALDEEGISRHWRHNRETIAWKDLTQAIQHERATSQLRHVTLKSRLGRVMRLHGLNRMEDLAREIQAHSPAGVRIKIVRDRHSGLLWGGLAMAAGLLLRVRNPNEEFLIILTIILMSWWMLIPRRLASRFIQAPSKL